MIRLKVTLQSALDLQNGFNNIIPSTRMERQYLDLGTFLAKQFLRKRGQSLQEHDQSGQLAVFINKSAFNIDVRNYGMVSQNFFKAL